ncbi:MAG: TRAP transporter small permease [Betaproteobacteria bacterium]|nr:MAG: TRAP transporter small permease [Betaproteobacteria bacterium]
MRRRVEQHRRQDARPQSANELIAFAQRLTRFGLWFGGALILAAAVLIGVDVTLRKFFNASIGGADELAGYALALGTAWSLGAALLDRAHIRIDSLYVLLPRWLRLSLDFAGLALFIAFFGLIAWHGWSVVQQSWMSGSRSQSALATPTVIPQSLWLLGLALFFLVGLALLAHAAILIARGNASAAEQAISTRSAAEEVQEEIRELWSGPRSGS